MRRSQEAEAGGGGSSAAAAGYDGRGSTERLGGAPGGAGDRAASSHATGSGGEGDGALFNNGAGGKAGTSSTAARAAQQDEIEEEVEEEDLVEWPAAEQLLRRWFYHLGRGCASRPWRVLAASVLLVGACIAGLGRFRWATAGSGGHAAGFLSPHPWRCGASGWLRMRQPPGLLSNGGWSWQRLCLDSIPPAALLGSACTRANKPAVPAPLPAAA